MIKEQIEKVNQIEKYIRRNHGKDSWNDRNPYLRNMVQDEATAFCDFEQWKLLSKNWISEDRGINLILEWSNLSMEEKRWKWNDRIYEGIQFE
jgi:hypothetical protein